MKSKPADEARGLYKMGTIAELTGLSPVLLRAWERRYDLLEPARGPGGHRLYTDDDLRVLRSAQRMMAAGRSIGEVAALGRTALIAHSGSPDGDRDAEAGSLIDRVVEEVVQSAVELDLSGINEALDRAAGVISPSCFIEDVIEPAAREIGELWTSGQCSVAGEHLASGVFVDRLCGMIESASTIGNTTTPRVIAACLPDERHQLGLLILSYFLNRHGVAVLCLGADLPFADLETAISKSGPVAVLLSVTRRATYGKHRAAIERLARDHARTITFYVGGHGVPRGDAELESAGVRLRHPDTSSRESAAGIASELGALGR